MERREVQVLLRIFSNGDELLEVVNRVKIDTLHLVEMRLEGRSIKDWLCNSRFDRI